MKLEEKKIFQLRQIQNPFFFLQEKWLVIFVISKGFLCLSMRSNVWILPMIDRYLQHCNYEAIEHTEP